VVAGVQEVIGQAEAALRAADFDTCYRMAVEGLRDRTDDPRLLALAGRAALELDLPDAASHLRRSVELAPGEPAAWRDLGLALVNEGDLPGAERALGEAIRLDPADVEGRIHLAHVSYARGAVDDAARLLTEAADRAPDDPVALRSLVDMHRVAGHHRAALEAVEALAARAPGDVLAQIDRAELQLLLGDLDAALATYRTLRQADDEPGHAAYAYHGMIEVEFRRERWRRALEAAIAATSVDRDPLTTDVLAFVAGLLFGEGDRPAPVRADLEHRLSERRAEHRRLHAEAFLP
jgi:Flp pilus assembly protein TadD